MVAVLLKPRWLSRGEIMDDSSLIDLEVPDRHLPATIAGRTNEHTQLLEDAA